MKRPIISLTLGLLLSFYSLLGNTEEKSIWREGRFYEGEEYEKLKQQEEEKIKTVAKEFIVGILTKDSDKLMELSYYKGFKFEKKATLSNFISSYHSQDFACYNIEIVSVNINEEIEEANVAMRVYYSTMDKSGGLSAAPVIHIWKFVYKDGKWLLLLK